MGKSKFVWVTDRAGRSYPRLRSYVVANPDMFVRVDEKHPVMDRGGRLLPTKYHKPLPQPSGAEVSRIPEEGKK